MLSPKRSEKSQNRRNWILISKLIARKLELVKQANALFHSMHVPTSLMHVTSDGQEGSIPACYDAFPPHRDGRALRGSPILSKEL